MQLAAGALRASASANSTPARSQNNSPSALLNMIASYFAFRPDSDVTLYRSHPLRLFHPIRCERPQQFRFRFGELNLGPVLGEPRVFVAWNLHQEDSSCALADVIDVFCEQATQPGLLTQHVSRHAQ